MNSAATIVVPQPLSRQQRSAILIAVKKCILRRHFNVSGIDYGNWARRFDDRVPSLLGEAGNDFEEGIRAALAELGTSHTVFYHELTNRLLPQHSINATLRAFPHDSAQRWHFLDVFKAGPAELAGIKRGDALLAVDGVSFEPPKMPPFRIGTLHRLTISNADGTEQREVMIDVPFRKGTPERPPIVEPKSPSSEILSRTTGLLKIPYFPGPTGISFANDLDVAISSLKRQGCDRLIVDLRGNIGGSLGFARMASYLCPGHLPIGHSLTPSRLQTGYSKESLPRVPMPRSKAEFIWVLTRFALRDKSVMLLTQGLGAQPFHGRVAILVNEWTNSAGEMLSAFAAENSLAAIIGAKTAGNVLGAINQRVGAGYWLRVPVFGWFTSEGQCLEGRGVVPDLQVNTAEADLPQVDREMNLALEKLAS